MGAVTAERGPYIAWGASPEYDRKLLALRRLGWSFADIAREMNRWFFESEGQFIFTKDSVQKRYAVLTPPAMPEPPVVHTPYYSRYFDGLGKLWSPAPPKQDLAAYIQGLEASGRRYKTLVLSDTQGVLCDERLLLRVLEDHPDPDLIVMPGDVNEWFSVSKYLKQMDIPLVHECDWFVRLLVGLTNRYPGIPVVITGSNHGVRMPNAVRAAVPTGLLFLVNQEAEVYLSQPFPTVHCFPAEQWFWQCGDVIYAHAEGKTAQAGDNAKSAIDGLMLKHWGGQEGVQKFSLVVTGHSHKLGSVFYKGVKGIEPGCLARLPMDYAKQAKSLNSLQTNGYAVVVQQRGVALLNECREHSL